MQKYDWAMNHAKVITAVTQLQDEKLVDPSVEINEETIKERYIKLAGLLREDSPVVEEVEEEDAPKKKYRRVR